MKPKSYLTDDSSLDINMASEPDIAYNYVNQSDGEVLLVENFDKIASRPQKILQPDDDLRRAITIDELLIGIHEDIRRKFATRK